VSVGSGDELLVYEVDYDVWWVYQTHAAVGTDLHSPAVGDGVGRKRSGAVPFRQGEQAGTR
jgi:hypothetical protein